jgi:IS30 family transposase
MSHLTELERWTIVAYRNEGKSFGSIAEELGHSKSTVARTVERFEETKSVGTEHGKERGPSWVGSSGKRSRRLWMGRWE